GFLLAFLARHLPSRAMAATIVLVLLAELRLAAVDLPQRHPAPSAAFDETRPSVAYLQSAAGAGRVVSAAPTEYELGDHVQLEQRFPNLDAGGFKFDVATARRLEPRQTIRIDLPEPVDVQALAILNSATADQGSQTEVGAIRLFRSDGTADELPLTYGEDVFHEMGPGRL